MPFQIYPPIGIARLGNSPAGFFVGPEIPGTPGVEIGAAGLETPVTLYKTAVDEVKRQGARFRLFETPAGGGAPQPAVLPAGAVVEWTVHMVNRKGGVKRQDGPLESSALPVPVPTLANRIIDAKVQTINGANTAGVKLDKGAYEGTPVVLGEIRTDRAQNLIVLGGTAKSDSPSGAGIGGSFYDNPGWYDDTGDGPVTAKIRMSNGTVVTDIAPAWVVCAPPDFAPDIQGVVSLYDIIRQVGIDHSGLAVPPTVSFTKDVFPILNRFGRLRWVNPKSDWSDVSNDWPVLADKSGANAQFRKKNANLVRGIQTKPLLLNYALTKRQHDVLSAWEAGTFDSDWAGIPQPVNTITADGLTRAALESCVGQGFFPGIEASIVVTNKTLYSSPFGFRINHAVVKPGDLTGLMALPWQADFLKCAGEWWPSQRPDVVRPNANSTDTVDWGRKITDHKSMVSNAKRLGFVVAQKDAAGNVVFVESQRAPDNTFV
jgi:L-Lysine epsilon oxidase N-terminal/L-lysine epsilon oxidase C-terminal domain